MENRQNNKRRKQHTALMIFGELMLGLVIAAAIYVAFSPNNILPSAMEQAIFPVIDENMGTALPKGSMAIVDKIQEPHRGDVAAVNDDGNIIAARVVGEAADSYSLAYDESGSKFKAERAQIIGKISFYSKNIGYVVTWLNTYRYFVVSVGAILLIIAIVVGATSGARARKRERNGLIALFEEYGEKYDDEESGIDY